MARFEWVWAGYPAPDRTTTTRPQVNADGPGECAAGEDAAGLPGCRAAGGTGKLVVDPARVADDCGMSRPSRRADGDFDGAVPDPEVVAEAWDVWRAEVAFTDRFVAQAPDLDVVGNDPYQGPVSLREVLVHMVEEYARHNGHADLLRERIDGRVGQ